MALELKRLIGVCQRTAWRLKHKVLQVMTERKAPRQLDGRVEVDDVYLGGEIRGGKAGRGSQNKVPFITAVETNASGHPLCVVFSPVETFSLRIGVPSEKTFLRIFRALDPKQFEVAFRHWVAEVVGAINGGIAVDGKAVRGSGSGGETAIHMVSAFADDDEKGVSSVHIRVPIASGEEQGLPAWWPHLR